MIEVHFQVSLLRSCVEFPSTPGSSAELLSVQSPVFFFPPFCPLKALCVSTTLCAPISPLASAISIHFHLSHLILSLSHVSRRPSQPFSIRAYRPRGPERITPLTSLCQMFMTKIDRTTNLDAESNNARGLNPTLLFPIYA